VWLQQESILFGLLKVSQACLEMVASRLVGGRWGSLTGLKVDGGGVEGGCPPVLSVYCGVEKPSMG
jgi:hypothetical protein